MFGGIPLNIEFFDDKFYNSLDSDFETPEEQKFYYDNAPLKPVIVAFSRFISLNTNLKFTTFLGDSEFDSYDNYSLLKDQGFVKVLIQLNLRD